jgi:VanZ family protein
VAWRNFPEIELQFTQVYRLLRLDMRSPFFHGILLPWARRAGAWLFAPALAVVSWGELTAHPPSLPGPWQWDKFDHCTAYVGLGLLATLGWGKRHTFLWIWSAVMAIGAILEAVQSFVGRDAEWGDLLANAVGATIGSALAAAYLAVPRAPVAPSAGARAGQDTL